MLLAKGRCPATCSPPAAGLQSLKGVPGSRLTLLRGEKETSCRAGFGNITAQAIREGGSSQHMRDSPRPVNSSQGRQPQHKLMSDFPRNSLSPQDQSFENTLAYLREVHKADKVISAEAWDRCFANIAAPGHARATLELMRADAAVRERTGWDWASQGYGQTVFKFVEAAGAAGASQLAEQVITPALAQELRLNLSSKDFIATIIRKVSNGASTEVLQRLYQAEHSMRGSHTLSSLIRSYLNGSIDTPVPLVLILQTTGTNTHMAAHELSRRYRKEGNMDGIRQLLAQAKSGDAALKEKLQEDLEAWLQKRQMRGL